MLTTFKKSSLNFAVATYSVVQKLISTAFGTFVWRALQTGFVKFDSTRSTDRPFGFILLLVIPSFACVASLLRATLCTCNSESAEAIVADAFSSVISINAAWVE